MSQYKLLRIYVGEFEKLKHKPLYEVIVWGAFRYGLSGAAVTKAVMAFKTGRNLKSEKFPALWSGMPYVIDIIDKDYRIKDFVDRFKEVFDEVSKSGVVILSDVQVVAGSAD